MELEQGTPLHGGTYRIEQKLGQGSFGITYLAIHTALNKKVAIKEFFMKEINGRGDDGSITGMSDGSLSMNYARKFQKEALNLSHLEHPNIVRVTDSFEDNGTFYYVMDYIEGENLNDYVKHNYISRQEAVDIIRDVAKALMYMHEEKHMLHLDLKPGNIMRRSSDGHIFLIDFGLSKHYSSNGQPETSTTIGLGTAGYAPIEQANQAKNGEFRPTIDVYALGATFYKLLTRETPPAASELVSDNELLAKSLKQHNINSKLSSVVVNAMLPSVRMRTQSVKDFLASLDFKKKDATINTPTSSKRNATNTTSDDTIVPSANNKEATVNMVPVEDGTITKSNLSLQDEGIWHEFVRSADGTESVYLSRIGKIFAYILFPWFAFIFIGLLFGLPEIFKGELLNIFLYFGGISFLVFVILYGIARIWHIINRIWHIIKYEGW